MPAAKPAALVNRHETKAEKMARESGENAMRPGRDLPHEAPAALKGHAVAAKVWRAMVRDFTSVEGEIVTRLDQALMVDYCILMEQTAELDKMRRSARQLWEQLQKTYNALEEQGLVAEALTVSEKITNALDLVIKLDGRVDRKRDLLHKLRQSLYLTPRARAGAAPKAKGPDEPVDELEKMLNDVSDYVNGDQGEA